jgi:hypothetical protein
MFSLKSGDYQIGRCATGFFAPTHSTDGRGSVGA